VENAGGGFAREWRVSAEVAALSARRTHALPAAALSILPIRWLHALINAPATLYLVALTAMLFRPPDLKTVPVDRIAFIVLLGCLALRWCISREQISSYPASWPMLALLLLGLWGVLAQPYEPQAWSLLAAKWIVPVALFHVAGNVFRGESALRKLETFSLVVLVYLAAMAIFSLLNLSFLLFPKFILDEGLGIHADRARGPFLQAVANGVSLNLLGLVALHSWMRRRLPRVLAAVLFLAVPLALLATRTRAVWLSAGLSVLALVVFRFHRRLRRTGLALGALAGFGLCAVTVYEANSDGLADRLQDRSPVEFRLEMYQAGWQMFTQKPITGWGTQAAIQAEIEKRISNFHPERYLFHNTYLELAVERGMLGLGLYAWLMLCLFRLGRRPTQDAYDTPFTGQQFRMLWPVMVGVYLMNASAVVMNYQFVNAYLFTLAGILAAQSARNRREYEIA
jgi:O-antigen ligase